MHTQTMLRQAVLSELWQTYILEFGDTHLDELLEECDKLTKSNISLAITAGAQEVKHLFLTKVVSTNEILYRVLQSIEDKKCRTSYSSDAKRKQICLGGKYRSQ